MSPGTDVAPGTFTNFEFFRTGDYGGMGVDPVDGVTFWPSHEYAGTNPVYNTFIASFTVAHPQDEDWYSFASHKGDNVQVTLTLPGSSSGGQFANNLSPVIELYDPNGNLVASGTNSITYTATGTLAATAAGTLSNTATVTVPAIDVDRNPANNSSTDTRAIGAGIDLSVTNSAGSSTAFAGDTIPYTLTVKLLGGTADAKTVVWGKYSLKRSLVSMARSGQELSALQKTLHATASSLPSSSGQANKSCKGSTSRVAHWAFPDFSRNMTL